MLTKDEFETLRDLVQEHVKHDGERIELMRALHRSTDHYAPNQGTDVIAKGPNMSSQHMLDEAARALGWRTDWTTGSPITWELVIEEIRKMTKKKTVEVVDCPGCKGRAAVKKRNGEHVEAVCLDCGCGVSWGNG